MSNIESRHVIRDLETLERLYGAPRGASLAKVADHVHPHYRALIAASPFVVLATVGPDGVDASPRGDTPGFVHVEDEHTLLLPDRRGNNRTDSLRNIIADPRVALFFLIPGLGETLRVVGRAEISVDPELLKRFSVDEKLPRSVLVVHVETVFFQCARAVIRSDLWNPDKHVARETLPSTGKILTALTEGAFDGAAHDRDRSAEQKRTLY